MHRALLDSNRYLSIPLLWLGLAAIPRPAPRTIAIERFEFRPRVDTVRAGARVTWVNHDLVPHTATAAAAAGSAFDSGDIAAGGSWRYVARRPGVYAYRCRLHPTMQGTLVVR